jgi:Mor family transcriptional regulator
MSSAGELGTEFLNDLAAHVAETARDLLGISAETAVLLGEEAAVRAHKKFEKQTIYIAEGRIFKAARTHELIAAELGHMTANDLARKYGLCRNHVYKVAARVNAAEKARRQGKLLLEE